MNHNHIKVVKINPNQNETVKTKKPFDLLISSKKIKEILDKKKSRINPETKFRKQFHSQSASQSASHNASQRASQNASHRVSPSIAEPIRHKKSHSRTKKRTNFKKKIPLSSSEINQQYRNITREQNINRVTKENLLNIFQKILFENDINLTNKFIKLINKKQIILILSYLDIVSLNTNAPIPLLKNLLYNYLTSTIKIIK